MKMCRELVGAVLLGLPVMSGAAEVAAPASAAVPQEDVLGPWRGALTVEVAAPGEGRHTIHSYFNTCPESPDGKWLLFFASRAPDGHEGEVVVRHRETGEERVLAKDLRVEDAHRAACQQWVCGGRRVVFHGEREGRWFVATVPVEGGPERVLARDQLSCWGQPHGEVVPLYGMHWNPGPHRGISLVNAETGVVTPVVGPEELRAAYPEWWARTFEPEARPTLFFPILSPDLKRVFFKTALPGGGDPRSKAASARQGLIAYHLAERRFLYMNARWGHPSWQPDSRHITEAGNLVYDSNDGAYTRVPGLPPFRGDHPSVSADGKLRVTDTTLEKFGGTENEWGVVLADARGGAHVVLHRFANNQGARSWRRSHPHPVFSADGRRIYYNVSDGPWTRVHVVSVR